MINQQKPIAADYNATGEILVHSIFKTIQGEGPFCGDRAMFIRLYGCNLRCPGCDTEYTSKRDPFTPDELVLALKAMGWPHGALIVITGGEPFRQNIVPAIYALLSAGWKVQVETNGVLAPPDLAKLDHFRSFSIVCSPKTSAISSEIGARAVAFKYVLRAGEIEEADGLPHTGAGAHGDAARRPAAPGGAGVRPAHGRTGRPRRIRRTQRRRSIPSSRSAIACKYRSTKT